MGRAPRPPPPRTPMLYRRMEEGSRRQDTSYRRGCAICLLEVSPVNANLTSPS